MTRLRRRGRYTTVQVLTAEARILHLAARGRRGRYGQVEYTAVMAAGPDGRLDASQYRAVLHWPAARAS